MTMTSVMMTMMMGRGNTGGRTTNSTLQAEAVALLQQQGTELLHWQPPIQINHLSEDNPLLFTQDTTSTLSLNG